MEAETFLKLQELVRITSLIISKRTDLLNLTYMTVQLHSYYNSVDLLARKPWLHEKLILEAIIKYESNVTGTGKLGAIQDLATF